jgi:hypothetical protein
MSLLGQGSDMTLQEALDLLHKLMMESTKVVAYLSFTSKLRATVFGKIKLAPDGTLWVTDEELRAMISFDPHLSVRRTYGDRIPSGALESWPRSASVLCFIFPNGEQLALFTEGSE